MLYLDLDRFKIVNDSLGHMVGDELLIAASRRLESCLRPGDALARLGGDEFAVLLNGLNDDAQANAIAGRIQDALSAPFSIGGREVFTSASIGIAFGPAHYTNPDEIMRDADTAMYHAKSRGKARHEVFDADMHARVRDRLSLENDLRRAIASQRLRGALPADRVAGLRHVRRVRVAGALDAQRRAGLAGHVRADRRGARADRAARHLGAAGGVPHVRRLAAAAIPPPASTASPSTCRAGSWCSRTSRAWSSRRVRQTGLRPADLRVEITETALLDSPGEAAGVLRELRNFGVKVYLDDFGTGYSSLSHLHKLPVDALKIDRSFVNSLLLPGRPAIVESILALARTLNTSVVAEGIESDVQARELERLGCTHAQGFLFSRPLSTRARPRSW